MSKTNVAKQRMCKHECCKATNVFDECFANVFDVINYEVGITK